MHILSIKSYVLNPYAIAPFLVGTLAIIFGAFLYFLEKKSSFTKSLLYFCLSSALWLYSCALILLSQKGNTALFWSHILYIGFALVPAALFHMSVNLPNKYESQKPWVQAVYGLALFFVVFSHSPYFLEGGQKYDYGFFPTGGSLQISMLAFFGLSLVLSFLNLVRYHMELIEAVEKRRIQLFMFCFFIVSFAAMDILASRAWYLYPSGFIAFLGFILGVTCFKLMIYYETIEEHTQNLEYEVKVKTKEINTVLEQLRATQLKLLETGKRSAMASLSAGILHQLSQPITAIHGFVRFVKKEMKETDTFYRPICHIEEQSVYIKNMLEDLMNIIKHREIKKENININDSINHAMNLLTDELKIRRVHCDTVLADGLPLVFADGVHLQQIFMNIIINSLQSLSILPKDKKRYLKITSYYDDKTNEVLVKFQDSQREVTQDDKDFMYEPFFSTKAPGTSIELAICKDLISEHGGKLQLEEGSLQGTQFVIRLPASDQKVTSHEKL